MSTDLALWLAIGASLLAVLYSAVSVRWILKQDAGNARMQEIAGAIQEGAKAYMNRQYATVGVVGAVLFLVLAVALGWATSIGFAIGALLAPSAALDKCAATNIGARHAPRRKIRICRFPFFFFFFFFEFG